ncbi:subtilisin-like serine protease [Aequorivita sublithincola DSM 14238]|uniref:Subtilisin-like serine protease n=1 Tax=Aequorivita sublithincola (strain DSM 14238 / LMG 21431 / ACAM 643 / 9-3) TaxID=746697 RepID=I3YV19_AEQSU|nr:S8 family serine peptidase [Aequorivita sublithincola]AFL80837.1 subtilisin-like serine protease [Aequorivita sublithincola DSM 14238]
MIQKTTSPTFRSLVFMMMILMISFSFGQNTSNIQFQDETIVMPENIATFQWNQMSESAKLANGYVAWVQFYETPTQNVQDLFKQNNVELLEYIPHKTYLAYFPKNTSTSLLRNNGVRSIVAVPGSTKISNTLKNPPYDNYAMDGNNILVTLQFHKNVSSDYVIQQLAERQIAVKQQYKGANNIDLSIPDNCLEDLANLPFVKWVELIVAPSTPDDTRGRSLHRSSNLDTQTSAGRNYTGLNIGVVCRDDGIVGPHIDFQGRIDNSLASGTGQTHGDGVSGIMSGAGNLNPSNRGMAAGSLLYVVNYGSNFLDSQTLSLINSGTAVITNSSYSNGCNDGYTTITQTVDTQAHDIPNLQHTFSAGNSNNQDCGYGAGNQWGNITGGHKQGKNVIATANVFFDGSLVNSSSRGPAHDGRIKPDIAANGQNQISTAENNTYQSFGGTSGASPGIAGISAQLYQAYSEANGNVLPKAALIKATLMNTANDAGNVGPDYKFGWGIVNGLRAAKLIEDNRFLSSSISQGGSNDHSINVPAGTKQVRFMVYWSDSPASPGANPALVNDLDLLVTDPSSTVLEPYILDPTPNPVTLNLPATNGPDHLNNVEQVLVNNPASGNYNINIKGFNVPMGPQEYFVVYEIISDNVVVTYPNAGESFVSSETESIHWDAVPVNTTSSFVLEYSINDGSTWNAITTVPNTTTNYGWLVPNSVTGKAKIRVSNGSSQDVSDETFSIAPLVTNVQVTQVCPTEASFSWTAVSGAESYDLYILGDKYMEVAGTSTTNSITVPIANPSNAMWFAAVAKNATDGWQGRRSIAVRYAGGLLNCSLANDLSIETNNQPSDFNLVCNPGPAIVSATIRNFGSSSESNFAVSYQLDSDPIVTENFTGTITPGGQAVLDFAIPLNITASGSYTLTVSVDLSGDENPSNDDDVLSFYAATDAEPLDYTEPFDVNGMPPPGWTVLNPDNSDTWQEKTGVTGSAGSPTVTAYFDNFSYNASGEEDMLQTLYVDLTLASSAALDFDLAKAQYSNSLSDGLRVDISTDCGATFTQIYFKDGSDLSTVSGNVSSKWEPASANDWRKETVDLSAYLGENVQFRFVNINGYGNSTFIDNINVRGSLGISKEDLSNITMYPNPASDEVFINLKNLNAGNVSITLFNSLGQRLQFISEAEMAGKTRGTLNVSNYATGIYFVKIMSGNNTATKKLIVQ